MVPLWASLPLAGDGDALSERDQADAPGQLAGARAVWLTVELPDGSTQRMSFAGLSEAEAVRRVLARGLRVRSIDAAAPAARVARGEAFALLLFSQELLALLDAGLNLNEALATLQAKERGALGREVLGGILRALQEGRSFSDVLADMPAHFPEVYVATVRSAERSGDLPQALARFIAYQAQFEGLRQKIISAAIYPAMLLLVGACVSLFLMGYVVPRFSAVYESAGRELPWLSSLLLAFGKLIYQHWQQAVLLLLAAAAAAVLLVMQAAARQRALAWVLGLPWFAERAREYRLNRFYRALGLLLASGIALPRALRMVGGMLGPGQAARLARCLLAVEQGRSLSVALDEADLATPVAQSLVRVGERSGQMAQMLERAARFGDEAFARWMDRAARLLEPILMSVIGVVIGTVVVLMYLPIFELAGSLQ